VNAKEDSLSILSVPDLTVQSTMAVGAYPEYVGVTKDGSTIFTTNLGKKGSITLIQHDGFQWKRVRDIRSGIDPHGWALSPDGRIVVITNLGTDFVYLFDSRSFEEIAHLDTGVASEFARFLTNQELWVTNIGADYISVIDVKERTVIDQIPVGNAPHGISFSSDGLLAFVPLYKSGEVVTIDVPERKVIRRVRIGRELHNAVVATRATERVR